MDPDLLFLLILVVLSAFFSSAEVVFLSLSEAKIVAMIEAKKKNALTVKKLKENPRSLLITVLIGNNIVNIAAASLATVIFAKYFDSAVIGLTTGIMTIIILIFGEIVPKSFASSHAPWLSRQFAPFISFLKKFFLPIIWLMEKITNILVGSHKIEEISEEELKALAMAGVQQGTIEKNEGLMIEKLFKFNDISAEDIMTPRVEVVYVKEVDSIEKTAIEIEKYGITRCLVIEESIDKVLGFVHAQDVLLAFRNNKEGEMVKSLIRPIIFVPKQMLINSVLKEFQKRKIHIAVVMDEYGGTEGIITLEDIIEELVGEIVDEHDIDDNFIKRIGKNEIVVSGAVECRDINRFLNITLSEDDLETVADFVLETIKKIPTEGTTIENDRFVCVVEKLENKVIKQVRITKK
ncbi:MAG: hemolysin family protein [Patescibacteria group bacterium]|nr:hemolysin family protein [Patescibacteria group bacterium]